MVLGDTSDGKKALPVADVEFEIRCSVNSVDMLLGLGVTEDGLDLTFRVLSNSAFAGIISWVIGLLPGDAGANSVEGILNNLFKDHMFLQRIKISVDLSQPKPSLGGLRVDMEVSGGFGQGSNKGQRLPF